MPLLFDGARPVGHDEIRSPPGGLSPEGLHFGACHLRRVADNGEDKEADPDALDHTDDRNTGAHKEKTEAGKAHAHQMEDEQF